MTTPATRTVTVTLTQTNDTVELSLPDWPGGPCTITHSATDGTVITHKGSLTQIVDGDYTLIVNGQHATFVRRNIITRTLGHFITFATQTVQFNPLRGPILPVLFKAEDAVRATLSKLFPTLS